MLTSNKRQFCCEVAEWTSEGLSRGPGMSIQLSMPLYLLSIGMFFEKYVTDLTCARSLHSEWSPQLQQRWPASMPEVFQTMRWRGENEQSFRRAMRNDFYVVTVLIALLRRIVASSGNKTSFFASYLLADRQVVTRCHRSLASAPSSLRSSCHL